MAFFKACNRCGNWYKSSRYTKMCSECREKLREKALEKSIQTNYEALNRLDD